MNQTIDAEKLKASAEHLEWVLNQYPDIDNVQAMLSGLIELIEDAKAGRVLQPVEKIPFEYNFADGVYIPYKDPNVEDAYVAFATEMRGGLSEQEKQLLVRMEARRKAINTIGDSHE